MSESRKDLIIESLCIQLARATVALGEAKEENRKLKKKLMKYEKKEAKHHE